MSEGTIKCDVLIIGAGAAGMMCAIEAGKRHRNVHIIDHARAPGEKIRISGGGRCNFTNLHTAPNRFISANAHFCKSALSRYTSSDFVALVERHGISWHEKTLGQLFCDTSSKDIIDMLTSEMSAAGVPLHLSTNVSSISRDDISNEFRIETSAGTFEASSLVIASGGKSIPKMGATSFGYHIAKQFDLRIVQTAPALVPLTFDPATLDKLRPLAGVSAPARVSVPDQSFDEALLFTHRGLSGPAILQISSYWRESSPITINWRPDLDWQATVDNARATHATRQTATVLADHLPKRVAKLIVDTLNLPACPSANCQRVNSRR